eukprot:8703272-Pyramimonas_sp.AAC.1
MLNWLGPIIIIRIIISIIITITIITVGLLVDTVGSTNSQPANQDLRGPRSLPHSMPALAHVNRQWNARMLRSQSGSP